MLGGPIHEAEAQPLRAELGDTKHTGGALDAFNFLAAAHGGTRGRDGQNVGKAGGGGGCSKKNEVGRNTLGGSSRYDSIVLWEVGDEDAKEDDSAWNKLASCLLRTLDGAAGQRTWI